MSKTYKIVLAFGMAAFVTACAVPEQEEVVVVEPVVQEQPTTKY